MDGGSDAGAGCAGTLVEGIIHAAHWELLAEARLSDARWRVNAGGKMYRRAGAKLHHG